MGIFDIFKQKKHNVKSQKSDEPTAEELLERGKTYRETDPELSFKCFYRAAELGNADAMRYVGAAYLWKRHGAYFDPEKSAYWYEQAAERGIEKAMLPLAQFYMSGLAKEQNDGMAKMWLEKASKSEDQGTASIAKRWLSNYDDMKITTVALMNSAVELGGIPPQ